jgi:hypothetical protein
MAAVDLIYEIGRVVTAFGDNGHECEFLYGPWPDARDMARISAGGPKRYISRAMLMPSDKLVMAVCGDALIAVRALFAVIAREPAEAVATRDAWLAEVFRTGGGSLGYPGKMPKEYSGVLFFKFRPVGNIATEAVPMQVGNGTLWRAETLVDMCWETSALFNLQGPLEVPLYG